MTARPTFARATVPLALTGALLCAVALGSACGNEARLSRSDETKTAAPQPSVVADMAAAPAASMALRVPAEAAGRPADGAMGASIDQSERAAANMIIRSATVSVQVDSLDRALAQVRALAASLGGFIGNTSISSGDNRVRSATIEIKVPAGRYDDAVTGLRPIGKLESVNSSAEDVGEEFVDVNARVANARRLEERLVAILATRTGKLQDVLAVERELARVREEIERYEGRLRYLRTRVATSTLTITVHEPPLLVGENPSESVLSEAFRDMWRNFVRFLAAFIASLGVLIPVAVLVGLGVLGWRRARRARAPRPFAASTPATTG